MGAERERKQTPASAGSSLVKMMERMTDEDLPENTLTFVTSDKRCSVYCCLWARVYGLLRDNTANDRQYLRMAFRTRVLFL